MDCRAAEKRSSLAVYEVAANRLPFQLMSNKHRKQNPLQKLLSKSKLPSTVKWFRGLKKCGRVGETFPTANIHELLLLLFFCAEDASEKKGRYRHHQIVPSVK